ncbi:DUF192 domain-containing protein [Salinirussus salinus]|uniref:DUF192 domain-containing protein n=1 Tax=Salinirussus salinus TaxID=1198300 RepID=UPI00135C0DA2|nr:DUF192 domain-containing protein [Salinirussus salinus]
MADGRAGRWSRREVLAGVAVGASAVAGCADSPGSRAPAETGPDPPDSTATPTREPTDRNSETETETATETEADDGYERTTVTAYDANGTELATVDVRVADTSAKRYTGLSDTDALPPDEGMWFVHPEEGRQAYVMRGMSFPLDIVFVDANGTVTRIFHADVAETGAPYRARAKYVLEVNRGWANRTGLETGDRVEPA